MTVIDQLISLFGTLEKQFNEGKIPEVQVKLFLTAGNKYYKVISSNLKGEQRSVFMFVDKNNGGVYKPASWKAPAKGVRYTLQQLVENPTICDKFGSFLYSR